MSLFTNPIAFLRRSYATEGVSSKRHPIRTKSFCETGGQRNRRRQERDFGMGQFLADEKDSDLVKAVVKGKFSNYKDARGAMCKGEFINNVAELLSRDVNGEDDINLILAASELLTKDIDVDFVKRVLLDEANFELGINEYAAAPNTQVSEAKEKIIPFGGVRAIQYGGQS